MKRSFEKDHSMLNEFVANKTRAEEASNCVFFLQSEYIWWEVCIVCNVLAVDESDNTISIVQYNNEYCSKQIQSKITSYCQLGTSAFLILIIQYHQNEAFSAVICSVFIVKIINNWKISLILIVLYNYLFKISNYFWRQM